MAVTPTLGTNVSFTHTYNRTNQRIGQSTIDNSWWYYPSPTPSTVNYTANALNQHTAVGVVTPSYDGNGNLTGDGTFTYGYDSENRLTSASGAGNTSTYAYDARSNRKAPRSRLAGRSRSRLRPYAAGASLRLEAALPALPAPPRAASRRSMLKGFPGHGRSQLRFAATAGIKAALRDLFDRSHFRPRRMENDDVEQDLTGVRVRWEDHLNPRPQRSLFSVSCLTKSA